MKKIIVRSIAITLILSSAVVFLVWYRTMKREVPPHARVIPSDAFAVLTFNLRELAADRSGDEHLFPDAENASLLQKELEPFTRAILANGATGRDETSDILMFTYHTGEEAFFGITVQLDDSAVFGNLMRVHMKKEINVVPWTTGGIPVMRLDTSVAVIGWTADAALFLYPLGHHGIATVSTQCIRLLKQQKENSLLANEKFCDMQLNNFALSLWVQSEPLRLFTGGGELIEQATANVDYFSYMADFGNGEILVRSEWYLQDDAGKDNITEFAFPCDPKLMTGFIRRHVKPEDPVIHSRLPLSDEDTEKLMPLLTGDCILIRHADIKPRLPMPVDSVPVYESPGIATRTFCFQLAEPGKAEELVSSCMQRDSIALTTSGWTYSITGEGEWRMIINDDLLTLTNHDGVDGRAHGITGPLAGYMAWFDLHSIFGGQNLGLTGMFIPGMPVGAPLLAEHLETCTSTLPVQVGNVRRSEITVKFKNKKVNALVQLEDVLRKIYFTGR